MSDQSDLSEKSVSVSDMLISNGEGQDRLRGASQQKQLLYAGYNFGLHPDTPNMDKQLATVSAWVVQILRTFTSTFIYTGRSLANYIPQCRACT